MPTGDPFMVERLTPRQRGMIAPHVCQCEQQKQRIAQLEADLAAAREEIARRAEDTARMDAVENLKLTVQHRSGITASVHPWMVRGDVGAWTGRSAREVVDAARAGGGR